ncbi:MAG: MFS transporter [Eubacteriaceae bacterium]|nr:MFS transporter [Eubacteriaceae bacterium]
MQNDSRLTNAQIVKYCMYGLTSFAAMMPAFMYYRMFMQVNLGVPAAVLSVLVLIGTGTDFVFSIIAAPIVEKNSGGNKGKYRWWFTFMPYVMLAGAIITFAAPSSIGSPVVKGLICILGYILICGSVSILGIANSGIMQAMAGPSMTDRNRMSIMGARMMAAATIITSATILPLKTAIFNATGNEQLGYLAASAIFGLTILIGARCTLSVSKPYDLPRPKLSEAEKAAVGNGVSVADMFKSVATNSQLLVLILVYSVYNFGFNFAAGFEMYFFQFWKTPETFTSVYTIHQLARSIASLVGAFVGPQIGMKLGKKKALATGLGLWGVGLVGVYFVCKGNSPWYIFTAFSCINSVAMNVFSGFGINYFLDCGEYGYYKTGQDNRTVAMAMFNIPMKIATMFAGSLSAVALGAIGFDAVTLTAASGDFVGAVAAFTDAIKGPFMFWFSLFPAITMFIAAALVLFCYKITDEDAAMYAKANAERAMAQMAAPAEEA